MRPFSLSWTPGDAPPGTLPMCALDGRGDTTSGAAWKGAGARAGDHDAPHKAAIELVKGEERIRMQARSGCRASSALLCAWAYCLLMVLGIHAWLIYAAMLLGLQDEALQQRARAETLASFCTSIAIAFLVKDPLVALGIALVPTLLPASSRLRDHPLLRRFLILIFDEHYDGGVAVGRGQTGIVCSKRQRTRNTDGRRTGTTDERRTRATALPD